MILKALKVIPFLAGTFNAPVLENPKKANNNVITNNFSYKASSYNKSDQTITGTAPTKVNTTTQVNLQKNGYQINTKTISFYSYIDISDETYLMSQGNREPYIITLIRYDHVLGQLGISGGMFAYGIATDYIQLGTQGTETANFTTNLYITTNNIYDYFSVQWGTGNDPTKPYTLKDNLIYDIGIGSQSYEIYNDNDAVSTNTDIWPEIDEEIMLTYNTTVYVVAITKMSYAGTPKFTSFNSNTNVLLQRSWINPNGQPYDINISTTNTTAGSTNYEVVDIPGLCFQILTMPFSFMSTAFNITIFQGTPYSINISQLFLSIFALLIFAWLLKLIMGKL